MYISYRCKKCGLEIVVPTYQIKELEDKGRYIACLFGHRHLEVIDRYDSLKECMDQDSYKKVNGVTKQTRWSR